MERMNLRLRAGQSEAGRLLCISFCIIPRIEQFHPGEGGRSGGVLIRATDGFGPGLGVGRAPDDENRQHTEKENGSPFHNDGLANA